VTDVPFAGAPAAPLQGLAFLELGERLRQRGQFAAAATVALAGLAHYPAVADAHDLLARIRADQGDDAAATAGWHAALECDQNHVGARKGLAFVAFRSRDFVTAERHLDIAAQQAPHDATILAALDRLRAVQLPQTEPPRATDANTGALIFDMQGMRLAGGEESGDVSIADAAAAEGAGLAREASRAARMLQCGSVQHLVIETADARIAMIPLGDAAALMLHRSAATPLGRLLALASRAAQAARDWLERMG
jgi:predicted regulator of Ras-like GTPase activity (Roadblock/LC7/MglB family)